jgi:hypothetical protein
MLSLHFYSAHGHPPHSIRVAEDFYEWLAKSDFSALGQSSATEIEIEGETVCLPLIKLEVPTRQKLVTFFSETIFSETREVLAELERATTQADILPRAYRLKKLLELLDCVKVESYDYFQRE